MNDNTLNPDAPATLGATRWFYYFTEACRNRILGSRYATAQHRYSAYDPSPVVSSRTCLAASTNESGISTSLGPRARKSGASKAAASHRVWPSVAKERRLLRRSPLLPDRRSSRGEDPVRYRFSQHTDGVPYAQHGQPSGPGRSGPTAACAEHRKQR